MGLNVLGSRRVRAVARATGLPVVWASVYSHRASGRYAYFTTAEHQHGELDRRTGDWWLDEPPCRMSSCKSLFGAGDDPADPGDVAGKAEALRRAILTGGGPRRTAPRLNETT